MEVRTTDEERRRIEATATEIVRATRAHLARQRGREPEDLEVLDALADPGRVEIVLTYEDYDYPATSCIEAEAGRALAALQLWRALGEPTADDRAGRA